MRRETHKPKLAATGVQRTLGARDHGVLAALGMCIAVGRAPGAAIGLPVAAETAGTAASVVLARAPGSATVVILSPSQLRNRSSVASVREIQVWAGVCYAA